MQQEGTTTAKEAEKIMVPTQYEYEYDDFLGDAPYEKLYSYFGLPLVMSREVIKMADRAREVGFRNFKTLWGEYLKIKDQERKQQLNLIPNQTEFDDQALELNCGGWESTDWGIQRVNKFGIMEYACTHPILPVERLVNIDTGEVKLKLAYKRPGKDKKWQSIIIGKDVAADPKTLNKTLSSVGISITQKSAPILMEYLNEIEDSNYDIIPESKSIGRLGYIEGEGFSPYVDGLVFDGDASFRNLYNAVQSKGSQIKWYEMALECRKMSVTARILLAASFASPLMSVVGSLPFFVHLWGVDSGTGKTVALMLAASVWGNPAVGSYTQTFNGTQVGQERTAAFLNHLPMCLDELQLTKNSKGQSNFDVYQLAQGVGRARGKKQGGVEMVPTWSCCFLTTGESPLTGVSAGAGAVNRVIDIECTSGTVAIKDGHRVSNVLKQNYGWAGQMFIKKLYSSDKILNQVREVYQNFFKELCNGDSTEKQAMAAAAILTADLLATAWIFQDDAELTVEEIRSFLASKETVSAGNRAYEWLCDWVSANSNKFYSDSDAPAGDAYGVIEGTIAHINRGVFNKVVQEAGFSCSAVLSYLKSNRKIEANGRKYTKCKRVNGVRTECVVLKLPSDAEEYDDFDELPL
ncbi:MAG: DUF927 domain-containing protein [Oscillospiraceae bacterium]|nr:DUF927 domain-containing protein [Oscillospiraceae bacterium]